MKDLYDILKKYSDSGIYPFHMPGHKRNVARMPGWEPWRIDVTEVEGTDNLHHPTGILRKSMERAAALWGAKHSYFLVNGSTGGILSAIASATRPGDTVLVARNCHKSVYHALFLNRLRAVYLPPEWIEEYRMAGGISPQRVERLLDACPQIRAVILTSPTYEGIVSDIEGVAEQVHKRGIPLIVDEAHGAHFNQPGFPESAVFAGADIVIQSCHKTLPALTQTGLLHIQGLADRERIEEFLGIYQTSSPSYVLMSSIDAAVSYLENAQEDMKAYGERLDVIRREAEGFSRIKLPGEELAGKNAVYCADKSKIIMAVCEKAAGNTINGKWLYDRLRCQYGLQCEMAAERYALAMTSVMDTAEGFRRLSEALRETDAFLSRSRLPGGQDAFGGERLDGESMFEAPAAAMTIAEAFYAEKERVPWSLAEGRISGEYLYLYPPGIPLLAPGERITVELLKRAKHLKELGFELQGAGREDGIQVCAACRDREREGV